MLRNFTPLVVLGLFLSPFLAYTQNVGVDVATPQQKLDVAGGIRIGTTTNGLAGSLRWDSGQLQVHDGTSWVSLGSNTDSQQFDVIQLSGTNLELSLQNDGVGTHVIDLSSLADNTDDQTIDLAQLVGTNLELSLEDDGQPSIVIDMSALANTDDQTIDLMNITSDIFSLSLEADGQAPLTVDLTPYLDNTDEQQFDHLQLVGTDLQLSISNDGQAIQTVDLSSLSVDTDDQTIDVAQLTGTDLVLSLEDDGQPNVIVDMSSLANTDDQTIDVYNITGDQLTLSLEDDGQGPLTVDLTPYKDNTDDQQLDLLQLSGTTLEISLEDDGQAPQTVDLSVFDDNTDDQTFDVIQLTGNSLELSLEDDGQATYSIDLSGFADNTDDQTIDVFSLTGTDLNLSLEDDATATQTVDLSPLKTSLIDGDQDTKVEVEANPDEDRIRFTTATAERMIIREDGNVGIGTTAPDNLLTVGGSPSAAAPAIGINSGNDQATFNDGAQIAFGYNNTDEYQHFIHTRHNQLSAGNNSIDFYVNDGTGANNTVTSGATHVMSLNAGNVGIGTTDPDQQLDVIGTGQFTGNVFIGANSATNNDVYLSDRLIDWDNTGYSVDISGISRMNEVNFDDGSTGDPSVYFEDINTGFYAPGAGQIAVTINGTEAMRVNAARNVGIGTTGPSEKLHVAGGTRITNLSGTGNRMVIADANGVLNTQTIPANGDITGVTAGSGLTGGGTSGTVTVTANANNGLNVDAAADAIQLGGPLVENTVITNGNFGLEINLNSGGDFIVEDNGNYVFRVLDNGNTYIGNGSGGPQDLIISDRLVDWDNTGYYMDPGGVNRVNEIMADDGSASDVAYHFAGDANTGLYQPGNNQVGVSINGTEAIRIAANRNVGFGTPIPGNTLEVEATSGAGIRISANSSNNTNAGALLFDELGGNNNVGNDVCGFRFLHNGSENRLFLDGGCTGMANIMTFERAGDVGVGTTNPTSKLHVNGQLRIENLGSTGTNTRILTADNAGNVRYRALGTWVADNLGNHTATTTLNMNNSSISNAANVFANRYYDRNNTAYYSDQASVSYFNDFRPNIIYDRNNTAYFWNGDASGMSSRVRGYIRADDGYYVDGNRVIDGNAGWHRTYGQTGWYNQTYGGGWYMTDNTWVRAYNNKSVYTTNVMRGEAGVHTQDRTRFRYSDRNQYGSVRDFGPNGITLECGVSESGGFHADGDQADIWNPGDGSRLLRIWDEDGMYERAYVDGGGRVYSDLGFSTFSDSRIKKNVRTIESALDKVTQMRGVKYDMREDVLMAGEIKEGKEFDAESLKDQSGFIAQELLEVYPEVVSYDEEKGYYSVQYDGVIPVLVEAIKEQQAIIDAMQKRLDKLEK